MKENEIMKTDQLPFGVVTNAVRSPEKHLINKVQRNSKLCPSIMPFLPSHPGLTELHFHNALTELPSQSVSWQSFDTSAIA